MLNELAGAVGQIGSLRADCRRYCARPTIWSDAAIKPGLPRLTLGLERFAQNRCNEKEKIEAVASAAPKARYYFDTLREPALSICSTADASLPPVKGFSNSPQDCR